MMPRILIMLTLWGCYAAESQAGFLVAPSVAWRTFSFEPRDQEPTPNYYGYGAGLNLGYSLGQVIDLAAYGRYTPGQLKEARIFKEDATLFGYGAELAVRFKRSVYVAARGGRYYYNLLHRHDEDEVRGKWEGLGGGGSLGAQFATSKVKFWQISIDYLRVRLTEQDREEQEEEVGRMLDAFSVTVAYVFNGDAGSLLGGNFIGDFLNSLGM